MNCSPRCVLPAMLVIAGFAFPGEASAYLFDTNDATTVDPGSMEFELQPVGLYYGQGDDTYFVLPSFMAYVGLEPGIDILFLARGYRPVGGGGYSIGDTQALLRFQLRDGNYDGEQDGASVVLQAGMLLPTYNDTEGVGFSYALLISHDLGYLTYHANVQVDVRRAPAFGLFASFALEGPTSWPVRPALEFYVDVEGDAVEGSALAGAIVDLGESAAVMAGARVGQTSDGTVVEGRLSLWFHVGP
ncbi:MAG: hypothetical protein AB8H86_05490 [Polyangiales bacterium]